MRGGRALQCAVFAGALLRSPAPLPPARGRGLRSTADGAGRARLRHVIDWRAMDLMGGGRWLSMALATVLPERVCSRHSRLTRMQRFDMIGMRASPEKLPPLARFIKYLAAQGLVEFGPPLAAGEDGLAVVDRIQQYAFMALYYGLDMGFDFTMCSAGGPASHEIADAVYRLSDEDGAVYGAAEPILPGSFREGEFLEMVAGRSKAWLDAATTILDINIGYRKDLDAIRDAALQVTQRGSALVDDAFGELKRRGMLRVDAKP